MIKALLVSKFLHIFIALPNPSKEFIKKLNTELFRFLWNGKRDRISRKSIMLPHSDGGIGMIDVKTFIDAVKVTWARREIRSNHIWATLFSQNISTGECIWDRNSASLKILSQRIKNKFWKDVVNATALFMESYKINNEDLIYCNIWYSDVTKFKSDRLNSWYKKGMRHLNDLVAENGNLLSFEEVKNIYNLRCTQFEYDSLIRSLPRRWRQMKK